MDFTIAGSGTFPATIPATNAGGFVFAVRGTDDISGLPNASWNNTFGWFSVVIPAGTKAGSIRIQVLSDDLVAPDETLTVTLVNIRDIPPAAGRTAGLTVSPTEFTGVLKILNDD